VALSIAATQAAGMKSNFGTMSKPLHAGKACANGLFAARLAARGFTANPTAIEAEQGFAEITGGHLDPFRGRPDGWHLRRNLFKYHASCFASHSTIEGLRRLRAREGFGAAEVDHVVVHANAGQLRMCIYAEPATGLQSKFSLNQLAAMTLSDVDTSNAASFTDESAQDPALVSVRQRVQVRADGPNQGATPVDVVLRDGRTLSIAHDVSVPASDLDEQRAALRAKFVALTAPVLGPDRTDGLADLCTTLDRLPDLATLMTASVP
jgi:2-methylcitrate dehydratase PrpD